ncbi:MAG: hypothetical protein RIQ33_1849 [Bacteroidota bacterium]|jgi:hypothetical protein
MQLQINLNENSMKGKMLLSVLKDLKIEYSTKQIEAKDAALGMGRAATKAELDEYIAKCMEGKLTDIDEA